MEERLIPEDVPSSLASLSELLLSKLYCLIALAIQEDGRSKGYS